MIPYIDLHCDTLLRALHQKKETIYEMPEAMVDVKRLKEAQMICQFFAIFFPPRTEDSLEDDTLFEGARQIFLDTVEKYPNIIAQARNYTEIIKNYEMGRISGVLTMEDGRAVQGSIERLEYFYRQGVRLISLTWNFENCFGFPNSKDESIMKKGLTSFGKEAISVMNELGILIDVSHLSDGGFYDVANLSKKPFVASHSNCRSLCAHSRNLTDEMIYILGEKGGVAGLNFEPTFLQPDMVDKHSTMERMMAHLKYLIRIGGEECAAIGSDFDGISGEFEVGSPLQMELFFEYLHKHGFSEDLIDKIAYKNVLRVMKDTL